MNASIWGPVMATLLAFLAVVVIGAIGAGFLAWRYVRRRWRAFHSHGAVVVATTIWTAAAGRIRPRAPISPEEARQWTARRVRHEMWRSVDQADAAVRAATEVGAPTASLPSLCLQLHDAAIGLDRVLRVESVGRVPAGVASQAADVMQAASDVQAAAVASAGDATGQRVRDLMRDAGHEIQLLDAGLSSARAVLPHPDR